MRVRTTILIGHRVSTVCHLATHSLRLGRKLRWDPERETFPDDEDARVLLDRPCRAGWELPNIT